MSSVDDIKRRARVAAMVVTLTSAPVAQVSGQNVNSSEDDSVRVELANDARRADIIRDDPEIYLEARNNIANGLAEQLHSPVTEQNQTVSIDETVIGPFPGFVVLGDADKDYKEYVSNLNSQHADIVRPSMNVNDRQELDGGVSMARFSEEDKKVYMPLWNISEDVRQYLSTLSPSWGTKLMFGETSAEIAAMHHEETHFLHDLRGQIDTEKRNNQTADMLFEKDYTTEKVAYSVQCLALANIWKNCKDAGIEILECNGRSVPLNDILSQVPGLSDCLNKHGFDPSSPESLSKVIHLASEHWDKEYKSAYTEGQFTRSAESAKFENIMDQIVAAREHKQILDDMTRNLDIGYGQKIDLPDDCKQLMFASTDVVQNTTGNISSFSASTEGLLNIDKYLDEIGLKSDKEKGEYLKEQYNNIINRSPDADLKLKNLMLACSNDKNNQIYYSDGLQESNIHGIQTVSNDLGKTTYPLSLLDERIPDNPQNANALNNQKSATTKTLSPAEMAAFLQHQGR